jgi:hypothetical protein
VSLYNRCKHEWEEVRRTSVEPGETELELPPFKGRGATANEFMHTMQELMRDAMYGWTIIEQRCKHCGKVTSSKHSYLGD